MKSLLFLLLVVLFLGCSPQKKTEQPSTAAPTLSDSTLVDVQGNTYRTAQLAGRLWMLDNLQVTVSPDGQELEGIFAYADDDANVSSYGRLYTFDAAVMACPQGWRLPTQTEWMALIDSLGGPEKAGGPMKRQALWDAPNAGATGNSPFDAVGGGFRGPAGEYHGQYFNLNQHADFWGTIENQQPWSLCLYHNWEGVALMDENDTSIGFSVRCVKKPVHP